MRQAVLWQDAGCTIQSRRCHLTTRTDLAICRGLKRAFTLVELLVFIAIIVVIIGMILAVAAPMRQAARRTQCLANQRQIAIACNTYSTDHYARLPSARTDTSAPSGGAGMVFNPWVNCSVAAGTMTPAGVELKGSLEKGVLWPYMDQSYSSFKSPLDDSKRVRSYSLNAFVGVGNINPNPGNKKADELYSFGQKTQTLGRLPQPARTMCSIGEAEANANIHGWVIKTYPDAADWIDYPAFWDGNRVNISLMDGSTESLQILSPKLIAAIQAFGHSYIEPFPSPSWYVMQQYMLPGKF